MSSPLDQLQRRLKVISGLHPDFQPKYSEFLDDLDSAGIPYSPREGYRSPEDQAKAYAKGPSTTRAKPGQSEHQYGRAVDFDIAPEYQNQFGEIAESHGLTWGGRWKSPIDPGHVEYKEQALSPLDDLGSSLQRLAATPPRRTTATSRAKPAILGTDPATGQSIPEDAYMTVNVPKPGAPAVPVIQSPEAKAQEQNSLSTLFEQAKAAGDLSNARKYALELKSKHGWIVGGLEDKDPADPMDLARQFEEAKSGAPADLSRTGAQPRPPDLKTARTIANRLRDSFGWEVGGLDTNTPYVKPGAKGKTQSNPWPYIQPPKGYVAPITQGAQQFLESGEAQSPAGVTAAEVERKRRRAENIPTGAAAWIPPWAREKLVTAAKGVVGDFIAPLISGTGELGGDAADIYQRAQNALTRAITGQRAPTQTPAFVATTPNPVKQAGDVLQERMGQAQELAGMEPGIPQQLVEGAAAMAPQILTPGGPLGFGLSQGLQTLGHGSTYEAAVKSGLASTIMVGLMGGSANAINQLGGKAPALLAARTATNFGIRQAMTAIENGKIKSWEEMSPEERQHLFGGIAFDFAFAAMHGRAPEPVERPQLLLPSGPRPSGPFEVSPEGIAQPPIPPDTSIPRQVDAVQQSPLSEPTGLSRTFAGQGRQPFQDRMRAEIGPRERGFEITEQSPTTAPKEPASEIAAFESFKKFLHERGHSPEDVKNLSDEEFARLHTEWYDRENPAEGPRGFQIARGPEPRGAEVSPLPGEEFPPSGPQRAPSPFPISEPSPPSTRPEGVAPGPEAASPQPPVRMGFHRDTGKPLQILGETGTGFRIRNENGREYNVHQSLVREQQEPGRLVYDQTTGQAFHLMGPAGPEGVEVRTESGAYKKVHQNTVGDEPPEWRKSMVGYKSASAATEAAAERYPDAEIKVFRSESGRWRYSWKPKNEAQMQPEDIQALTQRAQMTPEEREGAVVSQSVPTGDVTRELARRGREAEQGRRLAERQRDIDPMTGLLSQRAWVGEKDENGNVTLQSVKEAVERNPNRSIVRLDLNGFKYLNDTLGHAAGDRVLAKFGAELRRVLPDAQEHARVGGDELAVVVSKDQAEEATRIARQIEVEEGGLKITASVGHGLTDAEADAAATAHKNELRAAGKISARGEAPPEQQEVTSERTFYRGTNVGDVRRIDEPFEAAKGKTFVARKAKSAGMYGRDIEKIVAKPEAKILNEEDAEFWKLIGRRRPPNGYIGSALRQGETTVDVVNDAIRKAEAAGYDAISFSSDSDMGTVLLNENAFTRGGQHEERIPESTGESRAGGEGQISPEPSRSLQQGNVNITPESLRTSVIRNTGGEGALHGVFTSEGLRNAAGLPEDYPLDLLVKGGLIERGPDGYQLTDAVTGGVKNVSPSRISPELERDIREGNVRVTPLKSFEKKTPQEVATILTEKHGAGIAPENLPAVHRDMIAGGMSAQAQLETFKSMGYDFKNPLDMAGTMRGFQSETGEIPQVNVQYKTKGVVKDYRVLGRFPGGEKILVLTPDARIQIIQSHLGETGNRNIKTGSATAQEMGKIPSIDWNDIGLKSDVHPTAADLRRVNPNAQRLEDLSDAELKQHFPQVWENVHEAEKYIGEEAAKESVQQAQGPDEAPRGARVSPAILTQEIQSEPGYVYHATNDERLQEIADSGKLRTHRPNEFTEQDAWPDGATEKRAYFSPRADVVWQFAPEEGQAVIVRMKQRSGIAKESTGDMYSRKPIPTSELEYLGEDSQWHPVSDLQEDSPFVAKSRARLRKDLQGGLKADTGFNVARFFYDTAVVTANDIYKTARDFGEWSAQMIKKLGENVKPHLQGIYDAITQTGPTFFSPLERSLQLDMKQETMPADQLKGILRKSGVSDDEMKWTGFDSFLKNKANAGEKVTKNEALEYIAKNQVEITETHFSDEPFTGEGGSPKFREYTTPGGTNQREITLSLPSQVPGRTKLFERLVDAPDIDLIAEGQGPEMEARRQEVRDARVALRIGDFNVPSSHRYGVDEADINRIAIMRVNDRVGPNGEKILHLDEYQDDLQNQIQAAKKNIRRLEEEKRNAPDWASGKRDAAGDQIQMWEQSVKDYEAMLPFRGKSHELAFKHILRYAAEHGYDKLSWATGEQVADRYDLRNHIDELGFLKNDDGTYHIWVKPKNSSPTDSLGGRDLRSVTADALPDLIGKDIAGKITTTAGISLQDIEKTTGAKIGGPTNWIENGQRGRSEASITWRDGSTNGYATRDDAEKELVRQYNIDHGTDYGPANIKYPIQTLKGVDLKTGGEGKLKLYNEIIPNFLSKYGKKWGAQVDKTALSTGPNTAKLEFEKLRTASEAAREFLVDTDDHDSSRELEALIESSSNAVDFERRLGGSAHRDEILNAFDAAGRIGFSAEDISKPAETIVHVLGITPAMRDSVLRASQPLFGSQEGEPAAVRASMVKLQARQKAKKLNPPVAEIQKVQPRAQSLVDLKPEELAQFPEAAEQVQAVRETLGEQVGSEAVRHASKGTRIQQLKDAGYIPLVRRQPESRILQASTENVFFVAREHSLSDAVGYGSYKVNRVLTKDAKIFEGESSPQLLNLKDGPRILQYDPNTPDPLVKQISGVETLADLYKDPGVSARTVAVMPLMRLARPTIRDPFIFWSAIHAVAARELRTLGFDGAHWKQEEDTTGEQYQVWNHDVLKRPGEVLGEPEFIQRSHDWLRKHLSGGTLGGGQQIIPAIYHTAVITGWEAIKAGKYAYGKAEDFAKWSKDMVDRLGDRVKPFLEDTWAKLNNAPQWYSPIENAIKLKMPNRASVEQIRGILRGGGFFSKEGEKGTEREIAGEEMKWTGLDDFLKDKEKAGQPVTKQEILDHLAENQVQVKEVELGGKSKVEWEDVPLQSGEPTAGMSLAAYAEARGVNLADLSESERASLVKDRDDLPEPMLKATGTNGKTLYVVRQADDQLNHFLEGGRAQQYVIMEQPPVTELPEGWSLEPNDWIVEHVDDGSEKPWIVRRKASQVAQGVRVADRIFTTQGEAELARAHKQKDTENIGGPNWLAIGPDGKIHFNLEGFFGDKETALRQTIQGINDSYSIDDARNIETATGIVERKLGNQKETKYESYATPGGSNYRELLLTLPPRKLDISADISAEALKSRGGTARALYGRAFEDLTPEEQTEATQQAEYDIQSMRNRTEGSSRYSSSHWDEKNVLAHVRYNDRTVPVESIKDSMPELYKRITDEGKTPHRLNLPGKHEVPMYRPVKVLHAEEFQSDWHQEGRKKGYKKIWSKDEVEKFTVRDPRNEAKEAWDIAIDDFHDAQDALRTKGEELKAQKKAIENAHYEAHPREVVRTKDGRLLYAGSEKLEAYRAKAAARPEEHADFTYETPPLPREWQDAQEELRLLNKTFKDAEIAEVAAKQAYDRVSASPYEINLHDGGNDLEITRSGYRDASHALEAIKREAIENRFQHDSGKIPPAPFGKNWHEMAFKRMLRYSAENGYDAMTWAPGSEHFRRWGSEKIQWSKNAISVTPPSIQSFEAGIHYEYRDGERFPYRAYVKTAPDQVGGKLLYEGLDENQVHLRAKQELNTQYERIASRPYVSESTARMDIADSGFNPDLFSFRKKSGWYVHAQEQVGGNAGGIDIEAAAREKGVLKEGGSMVTTKVQLRKILEEVMDRDKDEYSPENWKVHIDKMTDKAWDRMHSEEQGQQGLMMPRKEGGEGFYDKIMADFAKKYGKKWGARTGKIDIATGSAITKLGSMRFSIDDDSENPAGWRVYDNETGRIVGRHNDETEARRQVLDLEKEHGRISGVPAIDITPAMHSSVTRMGQTLFGNAEATEPSIVIDARARVSDALSGKRMSVNPFGTMADMAIIAGWETYGAVKKFAGWSKQMIKRLGEDVKPLLNQTWAKLQAFSAESEGETRLGFGLGSLGKKMKPEKVQGSIEDAWADLIGEETEPMKARQAPGRRYKASEAYVPFDPETGKVVDPREKTPFLQYLDRYSKANLLMSLSPWTHKVGSLLGNLLAEGTVRPISAGIDTVRSAVTGKPRELLWDPIGIGKAAAETFSKQTVKDVGQILKKGYSDKQLEAYGLPNEVTGRNPVLSALINYTFRAFKAGVHPFQTYAYQRALHEQGKLLALGEQKAGLLKTSLEERTMQMVSGTGISEGAYATMQGNALLAAADSTFQSNNPLYQKIQELKQMGGDTWMFSMNRVLPFAKAPSNAILTALDYTPAGALYRTTKAVKDFAELGKAFQAPEDLRNFERSWARLAVGTGLFTLGAALHRHGMMTSLGYKSGLKDDEGKRKTKVPGALIVGGQQIDIARYSPIGLVMAMGATYDELRGNAADSGSTWMGDLFHAIVNKDVLEKIPLLSQIGPIGKFTETGDLPYTAKSMPYSLIPGYATGRDILKGAKDESGPVAGYAKQILHIKPAGPGAAELRLLDKVRGKFGEPLAEEPKKRIEAEDDVAKSVKADKLDEAKEKYEKYMNEGILPPGKGGQLDKLTTNRITDKAHLTPLQYMVKHNQKIDLEAALDAWLDPQANEDERKQLADIILQKELNYRELLQSGKVPKTKAERIQTKIERAADMDILKYAQQSKAATTGK